MRFLDRLGNGTAIASGMSLLDRLSRENDWPPDAHYGNGIVHHFEGDARTPHRDVVIVHPPGDEFVAFGCKSRARFLARTMSPGALALLLVRNGKSLYAKWEIAVTEEGEVTAEVRHTARARGLDAQTFKMICLSLLAEVASVEETLDNQGLL